MIRGEEKTPAIESERPARRGARPLIAEHRVKEFVSGFGVTVPRGATAAGPEDVAVAAAGLTPPLVVKAHGPGLVHKSDAGAVRLGLRSPAEAARAAAGMRAELGGRVDDYLVEEQSPPGVEVIVGALRDPSFGPVLLAGLGGVWTEALGDTALRLCPVTQDDAREMLAELRGAALLDGFRGRPAIDKDALVKVLLAVDGPGGVAESLGDRLTEFELNPVICTAEGAVAVDARLMGPSPSDLGEQSRRERPRRPARARGEAGAAQDFARLFAPRGVAVVGASAKKPNFGNMFLGFYRAAGYGGRLVAVHPSAGDIDGVPCVPSLHGAEVDYALVAVPAERCPDVVREARGVPFVQVMSGGFRETGAVRLEADLIAAAGQAGARLLGPNCMGVYSPTGGQTFIGGTPGRPGHVALISQSGGMAGEVIKVGERRGLAFSKVVTVGNSADVTPAELLRYLANDDDTSVIGPRGRPGLVREVVSAIDRERPYPDVIAHVNVQSFFTYGDSVDALLAYAHGVARLQEELGGTRITLVMRNAECAPPGVEDEVRAVARGAGVPAYRSMEAAAAAVAAGKTFARCHGQA
jgi:predicted CoA-binding protein